MRTSAPFPYYGAKARLAPWIIGQITPHRVYVEPFAGSCAVLFAKGPSSAEIINDLDGDVVTFFRVLRDRSDELIEQLRLTPYARAEYRRSLTPAESTVDDLERARRFCVRASMSFSGNAAGIRGFSFSCSDRDHQKASGFARRVERMAGMAERLRRVEIEHMDAVALIERWRYPDVTIYCDPPYVASTRVTRRGYGVEAADDVHARMLDAVVDHCGEIIVSGYANELYDSQLRGPGWRRIERGVPLHTSNTAGERRIETLWIKDRRCAS